MIRCPCCRQDTLGAPQPAALPQCQDTELPALAIRCPRCEYAVTLPVTGAAWRSSLSPHQPTPPEAA